MASSENIITSERVWHPVRAQSVTSLISDSITSLDKSYDQADSGISRFSSPRLARRPSKPELEFSYQSTVKVSRIEKDLKKVADFNSKNFKLLILHLN